MPSLNVAEGKIHLSSFTWRDYHTDKLEAPYSGPATITLQKLTTGWQIKEFYFKRNPQAILEDPVQFELNLSL
jgi:hypothetical protein